MHPVTMPMEKLQVSSNLVAACHKLENTCWFPAWGVILLVLTKKWNNLLLNPKLELFKILQLFLDCSYKQNKFILKIIDKKIRM